MAIRASHSQRRLLKNVETSPTSTHENAIAGVEFKLLKSFPDDRGFFREIVRVTDPFFGQGRFAQWSHSKMGFNTVKAWHFHHIQTDWWYVGIGVIHTVLFDLREESPTFKKKIEFKMGDVDDDPQAMSVVVKIPPGVAHGLRVLTDTAHLFYITSETYNPKDEGRYPFNSSEIPHHWDNESELIVVENDRRLFIPEHPRQR